MHQGAQLDERTVDEIVAVLGQFAATHDVRVLTNRRSAPKVIAGMPVIEQARKPFTPRRTVGHSASPLVVVGDQYLTDGLLAARLGATFIRVAPLSAGLRPFRTRFADAVLQHLFVVSEGSP